VDTCFHLAAEAIVSVATGSPLSAFESNIRGTWQLLEAARRAGGVRRVVVASSDKVYGSQSVLPYREDSAMHGCFPYDVSKSCADLLAQAYFRSYGLPIGITRCANIYGGGDLNFSRLVPGTIRSVLQGEAPLIRSDGRYTRDYLYIEDAVRAYLTLGEALDRGEVRGEAFNFGTCLPVEVLALVRNIVAIGGRRDLEPVILSQARNEIRDQYLSSENALKVLGWKPQIGLDEGLERTFAWYREFLGAEPVLQGSRR
jgi:CDP-glucose 4,6-dehydratase